MKFRAINRAQPGVRLRTRAAFTLIEVLASLVFMALVIPVAVEGLRIASLAGVVAERKSVAIRVAERVLNEWTTGSEINGAMLSGTVHEGVIDYQWSIDTVTWPEDTMRQVTVRVAFTAQSREYDVHLSTLEGMAAQ